MRFVIHVTRRHVDNIAHTAVVFGIKSNNRFRWAKQYSLHRLLNDVMCRQPSKWNNFANISRMLEIKLYFGLTEISARAYHIR